MTTKDRQRLRKAQAHLLDAIDKVDRTEEIFANLYQRDAITQNQFATMQDALRDTKVRLAGHKTVCQALIPKLDI